MNAALLALFIRPSLYWLPAQLPFLKLGETVFHREFAIKRFSGLQAGLLRRWRSRLEQSNRARRENGAWFCSALGLTIGKGLPRPLLRMPVLAESTETRNSICSLSGQQGLGISSMYPASLNRIRELEDRFSGRSYPVAERVAETLFTIPTHPLLSAADRQKIIQGIKINSHQKFIRTPSRQGTERVA
jgi:dTDP-4-amino-4,6-dideoxygalactose transaminase